MNSNNRKILIILAGGGFSSAINQIMKNIDKDNVDFFYVTAGDSLATFKNLDKSKCYVIPKTTHFSTRSTFIRIKDFLMSFREAKKVVYEIKPDIIISVGSSMAIPIFIWSLGVTKKRVFIESLTRVNDLSRTGKIIYYLNLASRFYVQWPMITEKYSKTTYKGKIL
tara:strand:+ start:138 stop:638 length:501 start_codon:yes stop_codon:yes gene_type:complete